jgi:hypothetical protein
MTIIKEYWTSKFNLYAKGIPVSKRDQVKMEIDRLLNYIEYEFSSFRSDSMVSKYNSGELNNSNLLNWDYICSKDDTLRSMIYKFASYKHDDTLDFTGILKGLALEKIKDKLIEFGAISYLVDFGGDIIGHNIKSNIKVNDNFNILKSGDFSIFTSGNTEKRGDHIILKDKHDYSTVTIVMNKINPLLADYYATSIYSDTSFAIHDYAKAIFITKDNKIDFGSQYIASPFFCPKEVEIRDKMVSHFKTYFRPDQTETSKKFDNDHSEELSKLVFQDNLNEIFSTTSMCFPMYTDDLGTLFEVGVCKRLKHPLFRYDHTKDLVTLLEDKCSNLRVILEDNPIVDCSNLAGAVMVGYNYDHKSLYYKIGKLNDNLMLSTTFTRVEKIDSKYKIMPKKMAEIR